MAKTKITVAGAGGIGRACALFLLEEHSDRIELTLADVNRDQLEDAGRWIETAAGGLPEQLHTFDLSAIDQSTWTPDTDLLLDCTPGQYASSIAGAALRADAHYANLTELTAATREITELAKDARSGFALQTGLAPGFINQYARKLIELFDRTHPDAEIHTVKMRVGALSRYASSPAFYAFTWNPRGVSAEYLNDSEGLQDFRLIRIPGLSRRERLIIDGEVFEADNTSGGASDLPKFYENKIAALDYKTIRYPGHFDWIKKLISDHPHPPTPDELTTILLQEIPFHERDRIILYAAVQGRRKDGREIEIVRHREVLPVRKNGIHISAIQRTTASSLAQTAEILLSGEFSGILLQSQYPLDRYLSGKHIRNHYGEVSEDFKI